MLYANAGSGEARSEAPDPMGLLRTYWKSITVIVVTVALMTLVWSLFQPRVYAATASAVAVARGEEDLQSAQAGDQLAKSKVAAYESLATSKPVAQRVIDRLRLDTTPQNLVSAIGTDTPDRTSEIHITARAETPEEAVSLADAWIASLATQADQLETESAVADNGPAVTLQPLSSGTLPQEPTSPRVAMNTLLGLLVGLALGLAYAFMHNRTAHSRSTADVSH